MKIDNVMVEAANAVVPQMTPGIVRAILEAALTGQIFIAEGEGQEIVDGKSHYPDYITVRISSSYIALDIARQLITGVQQQPTQALLDRPIDLMLAGTASISKDD
jgi:hypothetical protein